jgi:hypothetical protein
LDEQYYIAVRCLPTQAYLLTPIFTAMYGQPSGFHPSGGRRPPSKNQRDLEKMNCAVEKARRKIVAAGESVTAWKVSQDAMFTLKVYSWNSLGFAMQEVPNLLRLMVTEGKVMWEPHMCFFLLCLFLIFGKRYPVWLLRKWRNSGT